MTLARRICGVLLVLMGGIWFFQGTGAIDGSAMTNQSHWTVIGGVVALVGIALIAWPRRARRPGG